MSIDRQRIVLSWLLCASTGGAPVLAQGIPQDPISKAATNVQQEAASGQISAKEAGQIEGKLWQLRPEEQQDIARHGGLTPQDNHTLWSEIHSIEGGNSFNGNKWQASPRRSSLVNSFVNRGQAAGYSGDPRYENVRAYDNGYENSGFNPAYQNGGYTASGSGFGQNQTGSKFSQAASVLQNLLHH